MSVITILHDGEPITHIATTYGAYATLCGVDGDDSFVGQAPTETKDGAKIDCNDCFIMWKECQKFKARDFKCSP